MITIHEAYGEYLNYVSLKNKMTTINFIKYKFKNYILPYFKNKIVEEISLEDYINFQLYLEKYNYSISFYNQIHSLMVNFFKFLNLKYNTENIPLKIGKISHSQIRKKSKVSKTWSVNEYKSFIKKVDDPIYHALFNLMFYTGVRKGEALALKVNDFNNGFIIINKTLTKEYFNGERKLLTPKSKGSIRKIKIDFFLNIELKRLIRFYKSHYKNFNDNFFLFGADKPIPTTTLDTKKNKYCEKANLIPIRIHDFRHSHATLLYNKNIKIKAIQERLGHADISTTLNTYVHLDKKEEKRLINTINLTRL